MALMNPLYQYIMYLVLLVIVLAGTFLHIIPSDVGTSVTVAIIGVVIGWHIPTPSTPIDITNPSQSLLHAAAQQNETAPLVLHDVPHAEGGTPL